MSTQTKSAKIAWAWGGTLLAAILLIMAGFWQMLEGLAAVQNDKILNPTKGYTYKVSPETWGWIHLIIGALALIIGFMLFTGKAAWRYAALVIVVVSMISNFLFLPYYTNWPLLIIAMDVFILWSLAKYEEPEEDTLPASSAFKREMS